MDDPLNRPEGGERVVWARAARIGLVLCASAMCSYVAMAAVVSLQPPATNSLLRIPVLVTGEGEERLAGIQFDLNYDRSQYVLEAIEPGSAASDAGKEVVLSETVPGRGRVLVTGFNNNAMADGHVATLILRPRIPDASAESLSVQNTLATDRFGNSVPFGYRDDYNYPPRPPEKTEASLAEETATDTNEAPDVDTASESEAPLDSGDDVAAAASDRTASVATDLPSLGEGRGPSQNGAGASSSDGALVQRRAGGTAIIADEGYVGTRVVTGGNRASTTYRTPTARPNSGTGRESRSPVTGRASESVPDQASPSNSPATSIPERGEAFHVALATPVATPLGDHGNESGQAPAELMSVYRTLGSTPPLAVLLFAAFFLGFAVLNVRVFRFLERSRRRRRP